MSGPSDFGSFFRGSDRSPPSDGRGGDEHAANDAARAVWRRARVRTETMDFERLDRSVLRAVADERLRRDEARRVRRVLWPGVALAGALAAAGVLWVAVFEGEPTSSAAAGHATAAITAGQAELQPGDSFAAATSSRTLRVSQATMVAEAGASGRVLEASEASTRIALDTGAAQFEVGRRPIGAVFTVEAGRVAVSVIGTSFRVERVGESVDVSVVRGRVAIARDGTFLSTLSGGEHLLVDPPTSPAPPRVVGAFEPRVRTAPTPDDVAALAAGVSATAEPPPVAVPEVVAAGSPPESTGRTVPASKVVEAPRSARLPRPSVKEQHVAAPPPPVAAEPALGTTTAIVPSVAATAPAARAPAQATVSLDLSEDDRLATESLRGLVAGLNEETCFERLSDLRAWIADHTDHGRLRTAQHSLAYCYFALGRPADADRLFRHLGFKLKDILAPQPPRM